MEGEYRLAEAKAKIQKKGVWGLKGHYESPGTYKKALKEAEVAASGSSHGGASSPASGAGKGSIGKPSSTGASGTSRVGVKGSVVVVGKTSVGKPGTTTRKLPSPAAASGTATARKKNL